MRLAPALENWSPAYDLERKRLLVHTADEPDASDAEAALLEACRRADVSAFERLYQTHGARMKSVAMNLLGNRSDAEDAVQETFVKICRAAPTFRGSAKLSTWTYRILVNTCYDLLRRRVRGSAAAVRSPSSEMVVPETAAPGSDPPLRLDLEASLAALDPRLRAAFLLFEVEGFSHREVGEILGVPEGKSRSLLFEAKRELRRRLTSRAGAGQVDA